MQEDATVIHVRDLAAEDSLGVVTALLHRAYGLLAARGWRYLASHQDENVTRERATGPGRRCAVAISEGGIVGTVVLISPGHCGGAEWYERPGVAVFGQFAVEPSMHGRGIGRRLVEWAEQGARAIGAEHLACDTAEPAAHLVAMYERWGYGRVGSVQWEVTNYRSVILSKRLRG